MTRETKIGLLVGLAFIIVIGILLSDHLTSSTEPPQAALANAGSNVRQAVTTPGQPSPSPAPVTPPANTAPQNPVPTQSELAPKPDPIQIVKVGPANSGPITTGSINPAGPATITRELSPAELRKLQSQQSQSSTGGDPADQVADASGSNQPNGANGTSTPPPSMDPTDAAAAPVAGADPPTVTRVPTSPIDTVARQHGEEIVSLTPDGRATRATSGVTGRTANGMAEYKAENGDTVSRLAVKFLGANTKANRDLIIAANPSLKDNPDRIIVGRTYMIPTSAGSAASTSSGAPANPTAPANSTNDAQAANAVRPAGGASDHATGEYWYTVKEGDSLWRIAKEQLGKPGAVAAIKELNRDILTGPENDQVQVGMKIKLPAKPIASAN